MTKRLPEQRVSAPKVLWVCSNPKCGKTRVESLIAWKTAADRNPTKLEFPRCCGANMLLKGGCGA